MLVFLLRRAGVDPSLLRAARRRADLRQRASDPPERRPPGLPRDRRQRHLRRRRRAAATRSPRPPISTSAAPSSWAARRPRKVLAHARANGVTTSADVLAPGDPGLLEWIAPGASEQLDYLLPNEEQVLGFTGADGPRGGLPRAPGARRGLRGRHARRRGRARGGRGRGGGVFPPSTWTWWTPQAAATPSRRASSAASTWAHDRAEAARMGCATASAGGPGPRHRPRQLRRSPTCRPCARPR